MCETQMPSPLPDLRAARAADAEDLSAIRAACFDKAWAPTEFSEMLIRPETLCVTLPKIAYVLAQKIPPEAEIITIAVVPEFRRQGIAENLLRELCRALANEKINTLHLEVSEKLAAAHALYEKIGFMPVGRRKNYYVNSSGEKTDAILMCLSLPV